MSTNYFLTLTLSDLEHAATKGDYKYSDDQKSEL